MTYVSQLIYGFLATIGFAILFHVPKKKILMASLVGGIGWMIFVYCRNDAGSAILGCFCASFVIGLLADIFARVYKETATVYIIPGIIPLVPGAGMYYTTLYLINGQIELAATKGTETLLLAGSISVGLLVVGSFFRMQQALKRKFHKYV